MVTIHAMVTTSILSLPHEVLERVFSYLDWDGTQHLTPARPDILKISLVSRQFRQAVLPILFGTITFKLRWVDGCLVEPALFRLRKQSPHLATYVKTVHIDTQFGQYTDATSTFEFFTAPDDLTDWIDPALSGSYDGERVREGSHRRRANEVARSILQKPAFVELLENGPQSLRTRAERLMRQLSGGQAVKRQECACSKDDSSEDTGSSGQVFGIKDLRLHLDALVIVMLCLPPSVNSLIFEALPSDPVDALQFSFSLHVAAITIEIFGDRLQSLRIIMSACPPSNDSFITDVDALLTPEVLGKLKIVRSLTLSTYLDAMRTTSPRQSKELSIWQTISQKVTHLEFWKLQAELEQFIELIRGLTCLETLSLRQSILMEPRQMLQRNARRRGAIAWLHLLIEARRSMPQLRFDLSQLDDLSPSAIRWLLDQFPVGCYVDFERETRLTEDFESFVPLWWAEDGDRGIDAREARKDGRLVDLAMTSRWRDLK